MMTATAEHAEGPLACEDLQERNFTETLIQRIPLLAGEDRVLVALYLDDGHSFGQIARLIGASPTTIARRIRRIARQLADETYPFCLARKSAFRRLELAIIRDHFVRGRTCTQISRRRGLTYYRVRTTILKAREFASSVTLRSHRTPQEENDS